MTTLGPFLVVADDIGLILVGVLFAQGSLDLCQFSLIVSAHQFVGNGFCTDVLHVVLQFSN